MDADNARSPFEADAPEGTKLAEERTMSHDAVEARLQEIVERVRAAEETSKQLREAQHTIRRLSGPATEQTAEVPADDVVEIHSPAASPAEQAYVQPSSPEPRWASPVSNGRLPRLGELMLSRGLISMEDLERGLQAQRSTGRRLGETLVDLGVVSRLDLARVLADQLGVPFADLDARPPDVMVAGLISGEVARRYRALPVERWGDQLVIAMAEPDNVFALDDLRVLIGERLIATLAEPEQLAATIDRIYHQSTIEATLDSAVDERSEQEAIPDDIASGADGPVVQLVNVLLEQALHDRASDVHIEPAATNLAIRFRIDGILHDASFPPLSILRPLVSRLKVLGALDIAQSRVPQDGRFSLKVHGRSVDVRIATAPTAAGEAVVLRLLDPVRGASKLSALGLSPAERERFVPAFHSSQGAIVVTGPTGSGKSSTLYAMVSEVNTRERSIVSVEDPVEYRVDGVKQLPINVRAGVTFPIALRSVLRLDPDIVLIGEIRDSETARIAADASITGHLVLSTLHATRATAAPIRLVDMGVEPYLVASALTCVAAQRLYRKLCDKCARQEPNLDLNALRAYGATDEILDGGHSVRVAVGCDTCLRTGYQGRGALLEVMPVTEEIARLIVDRASSADIETVAVSQGMDTLRVAAIRRVLTGELTIEEMLRVVS
jgi:type IV pilus assembly protein PilB